MHRSDSDSSRLAAAVTSKIEAGNFKAAIRKLKLNCRIVCSEDTPAPDTHETLKVL